MTTSGQTDALIAEARWRGCDILDGDRPSTGYEELSDEEVFAALADDLETSTAPLGGEVVLRVTLAIQDALDCTIEDYDDHAGGGVGCTQHEVDVEEMGDHLVCFTAAGFARKLLPAFSVLGRDIASEIELIASVNPAATQRNHWKSGYLDGLRRAAEIVRNG